MVCISVTTNFDLHADPIILTLTNLCDGGYNTPQVSPLLHRVSYICITLYLLLHLISLVSRDFLLLGIQVCLSRLLIALKYFHEDLIVLWYLRLYFRMIGVFHLYISFQGLLEYDISCFQHV